MPKVLLSLSSLMFRPMMAPTRKKKKYETK